MSLRPPENAAETIIRPWYQQECFTDGPVFAINELVAIKNISEILGLPANGAILLGLDLGTKTIGLAISDDRRVIASPLATIRRKKFMIDADALLAVAAEYNASGIVLGLPVNMDGSEGPRCQSTRQFARNLADKTDLPIVFWDERLSTQAMEKHLIAQDVSRRKRERVIDKMAAQFILQGALDFLQNQTS